tara:strand:+ start:353 stop:688 length:336 start_codon:yes stop_codon:yes gene_type:complete
MKNRILSLSKNDDFKSILTGKKITNKYLTIFFKKIPSKNIKKLNLSIITKKKIGNAVLRNKIKRRLKNIMNDLSDKLNLHYSYLLIAKKTVLIDKFQTIKKTVFSDFESIK